MSGPTMFAQPAPLSQLPRMMPIECPKCGTHVDTPEQAHRRIEELETQVRLLNSKAASAVDKLADYEDEVRALRAQCAKLQQQQALPQQPSERPQSPQYNLQPSPPRAPSRLASLSSFLPGRRRDIASLSSALPSPAINGSFNQSTPNFTSPLNPTDLSPPTSSGNPGLTPQHEQPQLSSVNLQNLQSSLEAERSLRMRAESSLTQTQTELEELTATLFGQANEMVAAERKARHKLEERVKTLETRDTEKRKRLDRLESALQRIERVRGLVERRNTVDVVGSSGVDIQVQPEEVSSRGLANKSSDNKYNPTDRGAAVAT